jgi:hypothetical protein
VHLNAADQANAHAVVLKRSDLGTAPGWKGGAKKPDLSSAPLCPSFAPKQSDLVVTGAAESDYKNAGLEFDSEAQVLQTAKMVQLDWQRSVQTPKLVPCLRSAMQKAVGTSGKVASVRKVAFPQLATHTAAFRAVIDVTSNGTTVPVRLDTVLVGRGRTEVTLTVTSPDAAASVVFPAEIRVARLLASRIRA